MNQIVCVCFVFSQMPLAEKKRQEQSYYNMMENRETPWQCTTDF